MKTKHKQHNIMTPSRKTFKNARGKWIEKRTETVIVLCPCGNKYIQTMKDQTVCIRCTYRTLPARAL